MKLYYIVLIVLINIFLISTNITFAQEAVTQTESEGIEVTVSKMPRDDRGTDVTNIYTFKVRTKSGQATTTKYSIVYFLDDRPIEEFKDKVLPFSFSQNLKGQVSGTHLVKITLEDENDNVIASQIVNVEVAHKEN